MSEEITGKPKVPLWLIRALDRKKTEVLAAAERCKPSKQGVIAGAAGHGPRRWLGSPRYRKEKEGRS